MARPLFLLLLGPSPPEQSLAPRVCHTQPCMGHIATIYCMAYHDALTVNLVISILTTAIVQSIIDDVRT